MTEDYRGSDGQPARTGDASPLHSVSRATVLLVEDDPLERQNLAAMVGDFGYRVEAAADGEEALERLGSTSVDAIVTDLMMPRFNGFKLLQTLRERGSNMPAIVLTGFGSIREAVSVVRDLGAFWFLEKPAEATSLAPLLERAVRHGQLQAEAERLRRQLRRQGILAGLVGVSGPMQKVFSLIQQVAPTSASVLISGESGTGKERVAQAIHRLSLRATGPFIAVNCAAIPESLMESELFGHEKGAFTGAFHRQSGCFEHAHRGTLFLDEITEMPRSMQAKLLRALEESKVRRLGGAEEVPVDVRVLAATNRPIGDVVEKNLIREDLFFRLNVFHITLPPLRHRKEDIVPLTEVLIQALNERDDFKVTDLDVEATALLMDYSWPGNVRELRNVLERAAVLAREGTISADHLPPLLRIPAGFPAHLPEAPAPLALTIPVGRPLHDVEEAYIRLTLKANNNNRRKTQDMLGISLRTLYKRLAEFARADAKKPGSSKGDVERGDPENLSL